MKDIQQLIKKNSQEGRYESIFPKTFTDAVIDRENGAKLTDILAMFNMLFLSYVGSKSLTRLEVPASLRKTGIWITYVLYDKTVVTEWYAGEAIDDASFSNDSNWRDGSNSLVGDISISSDGYWVINGEVTNIKAQGEAGITPILRVGSNNHLQVSYTNGSTYVDVSPNPVFTQFRVSNNKLEQSVDLGLTWTVASDYISAWFRYISTNNHTNRIQISRDNKQTWQDISDDFTSYMYIQGYAATIDDLPKTSATGMIQGAIWMVGPTYAADDTEHTNPIYRMYVYNQNGWVDNGTYTNISAGIVQEYGNSTTEVISQDVITKNIFGNPFCYSGGINPNDGNVLTPSEANTYLYTDYIPITKDSIVDIYSYGSANLSPCAFYDIDKVFISSVAATGAQVQKIKLTSDNIPANARYIRCTGRVTDNKYITINSVDIIKHVDDLKDYVDNLQFQEDGKLNSVVREAMKMNEYLYPLVFEADTAKLVITNTLSGKKYDPDTNSIIDDANYNCYQIDISTRIGEILHVETIKDSSAIPISLTDANNICINSYGIQLIGSNNVNSYLQILNGSKYVYINKYIVSDSTAPYAAIVSTATSQVATLKNFHIPLQKDMSIALGGQGTMFIYPYKAAMLTDAIGKIVSTYNYHLGIFKLQSNKGTLKLSKGTTNTYVFYRGDHVGEDTFVETNTTGKIPSNATFVACNFSVTNNKLEDLYFIEVFNDGVQKVFEKLLRKGEKIAINPTTIVAGSIWNDSNVAEERAGYSYADYPYSGEKAVHFNGAFNGINLWVFTFINEDGKVLGRQQRRDYSTQVPLYADEYEINPIIGTSIIRVNYATNTPPAITAYERTDYIDAIEVDSSINELNKNVSSYTEEEITYDILNTEKYIRLNGATQVDARFQSAIFTIPELDDSSELLFSAKIGSSTSIAFLYFYDENSTLIDRQFIYNTKEDETVTKSYEKVIPPKGAVTVNVNSITNITPRLFKRTYTDKIYSNNINNSIEQIKDDLYIAVKDENIVPLDITIEDGYLRSDGRIWTNQTDMRHTSLFPIKGGVTYRLNCRTAGLAYNLLYDNSGTNIIGYFQQSAGDTFVTPSNAYYIALSLAAKIEAKDIELCATENILKSNSSSNGEIKSNSPESSYDIVNSGNFRLFFSAKLKVNLNESDSKIALCNLTNSNQNFSIDAICKPTVQYSQEYTFNGRNWITDYPYAAAKSGFGFTINNNSFAYASRSYPQFGELKGNELFRIRYTGDANTSEHTIEINDTNLIVMNGSAVVINLVLANYSNIGELVDALSAYQDFEVSCVGSKITSPISSILRNPAIKMVSTYTSSVSNPVLRKECYPFVVYDAYYYRPIYFELVRIGSKVCLNIDGQNDGSIINEDKSAIIQQLNNMFDGNFNIAFNTEALELLKIHININNSGEAEVLNCNRICSNYSKIFASWSGHGIYDGKSTNGKKPLYEDAEVTDPNTEMAVIPVKYKQWIASGPLSNILTSSERMLTLLELTRKKGYVQLHGDDYIDIFTEKYDLLPNKSFIWFNDDKHIYMYTDPETKSVISNNDFTADFAASKWNTYTESDIEAVKKMNSLGWKHYIHGEYDEIIFALTNTQLYTVDASVVLSICRNLSLAYSKGVIENVWITSNGLQSPNGINAFRYWGIPLSYNVGLGTGIYICRASNPLNLPRLAIGETQLISNVERYSII